MCDGSVARKFPAQLTPVTLGSRSFVSRLLREVDEAVKGCPKPVQRPSRIFALKRSAFPDRVELLPSALRPLESVLRVTHLASLAGGFRKCFSAERSAPAVGDVALKLWRRVPREVHRDEALRVEFFVASSGGVSGRCDRHLPWTSPPFLIALSIAHVRRFARNGACGVSRE